MHSFPETHLWDGLAVIVVMRQRLIIGVLTIPELELRYYYKQLMFIYCTITTTTAVATRNVKTRSQAVDRIADRTVSQQTI